MLRTSRVPLAVLAAVTLSACGGGGDDAGAAASASSSSSAECAPTTLQVGALPISNLAPLYVGIDEGFFEEENIEVEPVVQAGGAEVVAGLVSGSLDLGWSASTGTVIAAGRGLPIRIAAPGTIGPRDESEPNGPVVVTGDSPIQTPADLAGKTIAINTLANLGDITIRAALDNLGVDSSSVNFVEIPFPDMPSILAEGRVDAAWLTEPFTSAVTAQGGRIIFDSFAETRPELPTGHWVTTEQFAGENACVVEGFSRAIIKANEFSNDNPDAVRTAIDGYTQIPPQVIQTITLPRWATEQDVEGLEVIEDITREYATVEGDVSIESLILS